MLSEETLPGQEMLFAPPCAIKRAFHRLFVTLATFKLAFNLHHNLLSTKIAGYGHRCIIHVQRPSLRRGCPIPTQVLHFPALTSDSPGRRCLVAIKQAIRPSVSTAQQTAYYVLAFDNWEARI